MVGRAAGNEEAGRRKEAAVGKVGEGNGGTASRRGGKGDLALEVGNMQLTSRLARFLESQVIGKPGWITSVFEDFKIR